MQVEIKNPNKVKIGMPQVQRAPIVYGNDKNYLFIQNTVSNEWIINHNLNKYPSVTIIDSADNEVVGEVEYIDKNNLKVKFENGFSGKATLN